jgi:uncharacterized membrane protein
MDAAMIRSESHTAPCCSKNVGDVERWASGAGGTLMLLWGLKSRSLPGLLSALVGGGMIQRAVSGHCMMYDMLGISTAEQPPATAVPAKAGAKIEQTVYIQAPPEKAYRFWRLLSNLPRIIPHLESVRETDPRHSHWTAKTPLGNTVEWDAELIEDRIGELISWRSLPGSAIDSAGSVRFQPIGGGQETMVTVSMKYNPPGGKMGANIAEFFDVGMDTQFENALENFKHEMERDNARGQTAAMARNEASSGSQQPH